MPILLTKHELTTESTRSQMLAATAFCLLGRQGAVVANENDTIDPSEIKFGDNDTLAAELAREMALSGLYRSTKLVLLTSAGGLNRDANNDSTLIRTVNNIDSVKQFAGDAMNGHSRGGMITKVRAAETAKSAGIDTFIANGRETQAIRRALSRDIGTYFPARS